MSYEESFAGVGREVDGLLGTDAGTIAGLQAELANLQGLLAGAQLTNDSLTAANAQLTADKAAAEALVVRKNARIETLKGLLDAAGVARPFL